MKKRAKKEIVFTPIPDAPTPAPVIKVGQRILYQPKATPHDSYRKGEVAAVEGMCVRISRNTPEACIREYWPLWELNVVELPVISGI
jgi:hypothetical protein